MSEVSDTLRAARKLIEKPENWSRGAYARTAGGYECGPGWDEAVCWCALGALKWATVSLDLREKARGRLIEAHDPASDRGAIAAFNDHPDTKHPMVLDLFDRAIEMEEADG